MRGGMSDHAGTNNRHLGTSHRHLKTNGNRERGNGGTRHHRDRIASSRSRDPAFPSFEPILSITAVANSLVFTFVPPSISRASSVVTTCCVHFFSIALVSRC